MPYCHFKGHFESLGTCQGGELGLSFYVLLRCNGRDCRRPFIAEFDLWGNHYQKANFRRVHGGTPKPPEIPLAVRELSKRFVNIFTQATFAEAMGLTEVAGPGYGKALEILIKDYAIHVESDEVKKVKIETAPLGECIKDHMPEQIRVTAKRCVWLGNDETHYKRKWEGKDIGDLKRLLRITIGQIDTDLQVSNLPDEMPDPKGTTD